MGRPKKNKSEEPEIVKEEPGTVQEYTPEPKPPAYKVAEGKAITCRKGMLVAGEVVKVEYIHGGQKSMDKLVDNGVVIKK